MADPPGYDAPTMTPAFRIRKFIPGEEPQCVAIYTDAIRNGTAPHYTAREAAAWAPGTLEPSDWAERLVSGRTWMAEVGGDAVGFITLDARGNLDLFFVRPEARPLGVAAALYDQLLAGARDLGFDTLTTHASLLARSFLVRRGWVVTGEERALRHGVELVRFPMRCELPPEG